MELNALHNPGSRQGNGNEKAASTQRSALSAALGGRVDIAAMSTISGSIDFLLLLHFKSVIMVVFNCFQLYASFFNHFKNLIVLGPYLVEFSLLMFIKFKILSQL